MKKRIILSIKLALTAVFIFLLWRVVDGQGLALQMAQLHPGYLALYALTGVAMLLASNAKWHVLMSIHGPHPSFWQALRIYFIGYYFSALLPSNFGGDAARAVLASRTTGSTTAAATSVFMERVTGLVVLFALVAVMPLIGPAELRHPAFVVPAIICAGALATLVAAAVFRRPLTALIRRVSDGLIAWPRARRLVPVVDWFARFFLDAGAALAALGGNRRVALQVWSLTAAFYLLVWVHIFVAYRTFGVQPPMEIIHVMPFVQFAVSLPVAIGGNLGYSEGVFGYYFSLIGIALEATLAVAILTRLKTWTLGLIGMAFFFVAGGPSPGALRSDNGDDAPAAPFPDQQAHKH